MGCDPGKSLIGRAVHCARPEGSALGFVKGPKGALGVHPVLEQAKNSRAATRHGRVAGA